MNHHFTFRDINEALPSLAGAVMDDGVTVGSRLGEQTKELTFVGISLDEPLNREILLPTRKASLPAQIAETMWVLSGRDDVAWLRNYLPRAEDFSDDGERWRGAYGPRLRAWGKQYPDEIGSVDQLAHVVKLLLEDPTTRRAVMTIYDPATDSAPGKDIPCNNWLHFLARDGVLDLHVAIRSNDLIWGWSGINAFEWSVLLEVVAGLTDLKIGRMHFSISSLHIYDRHFTRAVDIMKDTQLDPVKDSWRFRAGGMFALGDWCARWFKMEEAIRTGNKTVNIDDFPEPMMRSWLYVLAAHWTGDHRYLAPLAGTPLYHAANLSPGGQVNREDPVPSDTPFVKYVSELHAQKHAAYGDSWKRRGEMLGIMANIARKVDRLGVTDDNETAADTAIDLLVYLVKYRLWLADKETPDHVKAVTQQLRVAPVGSARPTDYLIAELRKEFDRLEEQVMSGYAFRAGTVQHMIELAGPLAHRLWSDSQQPIDEPEERMHAGSQPS